MTGGASGNGQRKVRHELTQHERDELSKRLARVPQRKRTYTLWASREGQDFLIMVEDLRDAGVPIRWMAEALKLDERNLTQVLKERRDRETRQNSRTAPGRNPNKGGSHSARPPDQEKGRTNK